MTTLDALLAGASRQADGSWACHIGSDWMQGRTAYGGISAALALEVAMRDHPGAAPLRSVEISFIGPVGGECRIASRMLRQSKSSRFVAAEVESEAGFGTHGVFAFMQARESHIDHQRIIMPAVAPPDALPPVPDHPLRPAFTRKFEMRPASGTGGFGHGQDEAAILTWVRWEEEPRCDPHVALLALADALPPAALPLFHQFGPISSSTWMQHFLTDHPVSADGWWLLSSRSSYVHRGFSAQSMAIWSSDGTLVSLGGQGVALYV